MSSIAIPARDPVGDEVIALMLVIPQSSHPLLGMERLHLLDARLGPFVLGFQFCDLCSHALQLLKLVLIELFPLTELLLLLCFVLSPSRRSPVTGL